MTKSTLSLAEYKAKDLPPSQEELNDCPKWFFTPNYKRAAKSKSSSLRLDNELLEKFYFKYLEHIKSLIQQLPDEHDRLVYELDRKDEYENLECFYDFFSPQVRFNLICDFDFRYKLEYTIAKSPIEEELQRIVSVGKKLQHNLEERTLHQDYQTYYKKAMQYRKEYTKIL